FDFDGSSWTETEKLTASDGAVSDQFGYSVSLSGDRALIGVLLDDDNGSDSGSAYVFDFDGTSWTETQKLTASDGAVSDQFGRSVSLSGDRALIGAVLDDDNGLSSGSAYVFDFDGSSWTETEKLTASDGAVSDQFGYSVSLSGDRALIGAFGDDDNGSDSGSAYVFGFASPDSDGDGYTDEEELACGTDPNDDTSFPAGTVSGTVTAGGNMQAGITVKALDADDPAIVLGTAVTDASGNYSIAGVAQGDVVVMVVEPLGFSAQANDLGEAVVCNTTTADVDFTLDALVLTNDIRMASYWKNQLDIAASGGTPAEDFSTIITEIEDRFTNVHFNALFAGVNDVDAWQDIFSKRPGTATERATAEVGALVMNVMSLKIDQFEVVTADGFTVADVVTHVATLLEDGDVSNDATAKSLAEQVNRGMTIAAGQIGAGNIAYKRGGPGVGPILDVSSTAQALPESFELEGNYPNPFNPQTSIRFAMPEAAHVSVSVYDALGRQVATLMDGVQEAGYHEVNFDAASLPSGTYLYRLVTPAGEFTKTMLLLK
ncbi:MAG: T9SS type A sorting domain-containing protein, partial [Bacteroidota bacterium]